MAIINVSTVSEFLALNNTAKNGDTIKVIVDLNFGSRIFTDSLVTLPECTLDLMGNRLLNISISAQKSEVSVIRSIRNDETGSYYGKSVLLNADQIDVVVNNATGSVNVMLGFETVDNCRFTVRADCLHYRTLSNGRFVTNSAFLLNVTARTSLYGIASPRVGTGDYVRNCSVGGSLTTKEGSNISAIGTFEKIERCVVNAIVQNWNGSTYVLSNDERTKDITDCVVGGVVKAGSTSGITASLCYRSSITRCVVSAEFIANTIRVFCEYPYYLGKSVYINNNIFRGKLTYNRNSLMSIFGTEDDSTYNGYFSGNYRLNTTKANDVVIQGESNILGKVATYEQLADISFYRELGFNIY